MQIKDKITLFYSVELDQALDAEITVEENYTLVVISLSQEGELFTIRNKDWVSTIRSDMDVSYGDHFCKPLEKIFQKIPKVMHYVNVTKEDNQSLMDYFENLRKAVYKLFEEKQK